MPVPVFTTGEVLTAANMNAIGLWKIASGTVSGTTYAVNNCFSSNYTNYRVLIQGLTGAGVGITMRLRVGGVDNNSAVYYSGNQYIAYGGGSSGTYGDNANNQWAWSYTTTVISDWAFEFYNPFSIANTGVSFLGHAPDTGRYGSGYHGSNASFDGFSITNSGGFTGGKITVYGYRA